MTGFTEVLAAVAATVIAAKDELCRLDGVAGDGDLGVTMSTAGAVLKTLRPELEGQDLTVALRRCGTELARRVPSTSGTLVATGFLRAARAAEASSDAGLPLLASLLEAAQDGIQERGKASLGDKTLLDALAPAVDAIRDAAARNRSVSEAMDAAAAASAGGAAATRQMQAKVGRAGWLAERSRGQEDAGARLVAIVFESAAGSVREMVKEREGE
ncbi:MAG: DAK2 domain-containing protein [Chloroflexota bacterium]